MLGQVIRIVGVITAVGWAGAFLVLAYEQFAPPTPASQGAVIVFGLVGGIGFFALVIYAIASRKSGPVVQSPARWSWCIEAPDGSVFVTHSLPQAPSEGFQLVLPGGTYAVQVDGMIASESGAVGIGVERLSITRRGCTAGPIVEGHRVIVDSGLLVVLGWPGRDLRFVTSLEERGNVLQAVRCFTNDVGAGFCMLPSESGSWGVVLAPGDGVYPVNVASNDEGIVSIQIDLRELSMPEKTA